MIGDLSEIFGTFITNNIYVEAAVSIITFTIVMMFIYNMFWSLTGFVRGTK